MDEQTDTIFDFDPIEDGDFNENNNKNDNNHNNGRGNSGDNGGNENGSKLTKQYTILDTIESQIEQQEKEDLDDHDAQLLNEQNAYNILLNDAENDENIPIKNKDREEDQLDEEDLYDKFIPTNRSKVEEYLSNKNKTKKSEFIIKSDTDSLKIRFNKNVVGIYTPPENFSRVSDGIYRSSFPRIENFEFLKNLKLKSILCLIPEEYPIENIEFNNESQIKFFQIGLSGNKEPFVKIKPELVNEALKILINPENQPILIHCNRGKHRTGCIVGCIRKLQQWSLSMIFDEYRKFAYPKERPLDQQFIEMFDDSMIELFAIENKLLPIPW